MGNNNLKTIGLNKWLFMLYGVLVVLMCAWTSMSLPPAYVRFAYLLVMIAPLILWVPSWTPIVLTLFVTISQNGFAPSFMPSNEWFIVVILLAILLIRYNKNHIPTRPLLILLVIYSFAVNTLTGGTSEEIYQPLLCVFLFAFFVPQNDSDLPHLFSYAFIIASLAISILFFFYGDAFTVQVGDEERTYWSDPNYLGCQIGMGFTAGLIELFFMKKRNWFAFILIIATLVFSVITLLRIASRGAIVAIAIPFALLTLFSRGRLLYKIIVVIVLFYLLYLVYMNGIMNAIIYRMTNEGTLETAGSRITIWSVKLKSFFSTDTSFLKLVFGYGNLGGQQLGYSSIRGFHNDFLAFLVEYGFIGFVAFIILMFKPLKERNNRIIVLCGTMYLVACCMGLEPLSHGILPFYAFLFYLYVWSKAPNKSYS